MTIDPEVQPVDPARLESGAWCRRAQKMIGEGDISASYSADRIGMGKPVRKPFSWSGGLWVCVGTSGRAGEVSAEAYRLVHPQVFEDRPATYAERTRNGDVARTDPDGFYHGMSVKHAGADMVLYGPPVRFVQGKQQQLDLF